jgi:hypothetical protein
MHTPSSLFWYAQEKEQQVQHDLEQEELQLRPGTRARVAHWLHALADRLDPKALPKRVSQEPSI